MAAKDKDILDTTKNSAPKKKRKIPFKKIFIFFLIITLLVGGGAAVFYIYFTDKPGEIKKSGLSKEILVFTFNFMPGVHTGIKSLNDEIIITEKEIERIKEIEKEYPDQEKITTSEKKIWDKNLLILTSFLVKQEKEIKDIYVSYQVNKETGQKLVDEKKEALATASTEVITPSTVLTEKIKAIEAAKGFLDKIKDFLKI